MLKKLLKYDLIWVYKVVMVFYVLSVISAAFTRLFYSVENSVLFSVLGGIFRGILIGLLINALVNGLIRCWVRFATNVYKDESYLTHTLPVSKKTIFLSKVITAIVCSFTSVLVALLSIFIAFYSEANMSALKKYLKIAASTYDMSVVGFLLVVALVVFLEIAFVMLVGYTGIIIGHKFSQNKNTLSVVFSVALYMLTSALTLGIVYIVGLFNKSVMNIINTTEIINMSAIKTVMYAGIAIYLVYNIVYYIVGKKLLSQGVNVE